MNREMPLYALQKGSVLMSEKTSGMLAHPNTSAASADGLRKARAAYKASVIFSCHASLNLSIPQELLAAFPVHIHTHTHARPLPIYF